jgi:iron complex outermembrane recepter protein
MNLVLSRQKSFAPHTFLPLCFLINILAIAVSIPANARSLVANNSYQGQSSAPAVNRPLTRKLLTQAATVKITGVKVSTTAKGIEIRLESPTASITQPASQNSNVTVSYDIPNATLALPSATEYRAVNPDRGIAEISVVQIAPTSVRVSITGKEALPEIKVATGTDGLTFSATPALVANDEIDINVIGRRKGGYLVPNASTATGTNTPILETPASVQVVPQEVIRDRQATQVREALTSVSGVTYNGDGGSRGGEQYIIRGFTGASVLRDGFQRSDTGGEFPPSTDVATIERIEVLKGPASILYGAIEPGGLINIVSKQPLATPFREVELQVGSRNLFRPRFDVSGPLTPDGKVLYRVNGVYETSNSVRALTEKNQKFVLAPTIAWKVGDNTDLSISAEYIDGKRPADFGIPAIGNKVANVPIDRIITEPSDSVTNRSLNVGYNVEHRFNPNWKIKNAFRYSSSQYDYGVIALPIAFNDTTNTVTRIFAAQDSRLDDYVLQTSLTGEFTTGAVKHTLLTGFDYARKNGQVTNRTGTPSSLDLFNPVYGVTKPSESSLTPFTDNTARTDIYGVYLQDQVGITKDVKLLAGIRYDALTQNNIDLLVAANDPFREAKVQTSAVTPRIGLLYQVTPAVSVYGSYSQSFAPNTNTLRTTTGQLLDPQRGRGYEFGVKSELLDGKLLATLAYFDITKQNVAVDDPNDPFASLASGEQKSRGIELDVSGQLAPGWKLIASYANTKGEVTANSDPTQIGNKLYGLPENTFSLWSTYEFQQGGLKGLGFGAGLNYVSERQGDLANTFTADSYLTVNAAIFYKRDDWRFGLGFKNIGDVKYVENVGNRRSSANQYGDPFTVQANVSWQF